MTKVKELLKREKLVFNNYDLKVENEKVILYGIGLKDLVSVEEDMHFLYEDIYSLGETIYFEIENVFTKEELLNKKQLNIVVNKWNGVEERSYNYVEHLYNNVLSVTCDNKIFENLRIKNSILNFFRKYDIPYLPDVDECDLYEGYQNILLHQQKDAAKYRIDVDLIVHTALTIYVLDFLRSIIDKSTYKRYIDFLVNFFRREENDKCTYMDQLTIMSDAFKRDYISNIKDASKEYWEKLSDEGNIIVETNNLALASFIIFKKSTEVKYHYCERCNKKALDLHKGLCDECYDENDNFKKNDKRKSNYRLAKEIVTQLELLKNSDIIILLNTRENYRKNKFKEPNKEDIEFLQKLEAQYLK